MKLGQNTFTSAKILLWRSLMPWLSKAGNWNLLGINHWARDVPFDFLLKLKWSLSVWGFFLIIVAPCASRVMAFLLASLYPSTQNLSTNRELQRAWPSLSSDLSSTLNLCNPHEALPLLPCKDNPSLSLPSWYSFSFSSNSVLWHFRALNIWRPLLQKLLNSSHQEFYISWQVYNFSRSFQACLRSVGARAFDDKRSGGFQNVRVDCQQTPICKDKRHAKAKSRTEISETSL